MRKFLPLFTLIFFVSIFYGCDKEKIITTTETIQEIEYIELPPDTVMVTDSIFMNSTDTLIINYTDTLNLTSTDTMIVNITDTINLVITDTLTMYDTIQQTVIFVDTVQVIKNNYDTVVVTVTVTDTIVQGNLTPDPFYAYSALQFQTDPAVIQFVNSEFGFTDGWIFYLSSFQNQVTSPSEGVYDFYGYIDYWTPDWVSYYPLEYYWRVTYSGGDPSNPNNWTLTDPPDAVNGNLGGIKNITDRVTPNLK